MAEFDPPPVPVRFVMDEVAAGQVCLPANQFSPCQYHSFIAVLP